MSSFYCEICHQAIIDTPDGFTTECEHHPLEEMNISHEDLVKKLRKEWDDSPDKK